MKDVTRWILLFLCSGVAIAGHAQQASPIDIDILTQSDLLDDASLNTENLVTIDQLGNSNEVELIQQQQAYQNNQARVIQRGDQNRAQLAQEGWNNQVILLQNGSENAFSLDLSGSGNDIAVIQNGDRNEINQSLLESRDVNVEFIQNGNGNLIEHQAEGLISKDIKVLQDGNNMQVIINQTTSAFPSGN